MKELNFLSHKRFYWIYFNSLITVFGSFVIISKWIIFETANDSKIVILPFTVSFLIHYSFTKLVKFLIVIEKFKSS